MAIEVFGLKVGVPVAQEESLEDRLMRVCGKRNERNILKLFLTGKGYKKEDTRIDEIRKEAQDAASFKKSNGAERYREPAVDYFLKQLKGRQTSAGISLYEDLVLRIIDKIGDPTSGRYSRKIRQTENSILEPPISFPGAHKKAEILLMGRLRSGVGPTEIDRYLTAQEEERRMRLVAKEIFFGINHGLEGEKIVQFVSLMYELGRLETASATNGAEIRNIVLNCFLNDEELTLAHIKCLRFTYPFGNRLELLDHSSDAEVFTKDGRKHQPVSEKELFNRLLDLRLMFQVHGIKTRLLLLISNQDLRDYFPDGSGEGIIPDEDLVKAEKSLVRYKQHLDSILSRQVEVCYLREYLEQQGALQDFDQQREETIRELNRGRSRLPEGFVESRVGYRYESNQRIFEFNPGRDFARRRVYAQMASLQALVVLKRSPNLVLIEEDRGDENQFIGGVRGSALPVFFMKLRDKLEE